MDVLVPQLLFRSAALLILERGAKIPKKNKIKHEIQLRDEAKPQTHEDFKVQG